MSMYGEQDQYKFLERIAIALERLAACPATGLPLANTTPQAQMRPTPSPGLVQHLKPSVPKTLNATSTVEDLKATPIDPSKKQ